MPEKSDMYHISHKMHASSSPVCLPSPQPLHSTGNYYSSSHQERGGAGAKARSGVNIHSQCSEASLVPLKGCSHRRIDLASERICSGEVV